LKTNYYTSLWNYIYHDEPRSLEQVVSQMWDEGFGVELWPYFFSLDPYRPALQTRPTAIERGFKDLFDATNLEHLLSAVSGVQTTWHSRGTGERPLRVTTYEEHATQIDTAVTIGSTIISLHDIGESVTNTRIDDDVGIANHVVEYAQSRGVMLALETGKFDACLKATKLLPGLQICLDPAYIFSVSDKRLGDYLDTFSERICYLHLYDSTAQGGHLTPGTGDIPEEDWKLLLRWMRDVEFQGPAVFEVRPPPWKAGQTALDAVIEAREYLERLAANL